VIPLTEDDLEGGVCVMIGANEWRGDPTPQDWMAVYLLCLERAREELRLPTGQAELWANGEADRLLYGPPAPEKGTLSGGERAAPTANRADRPAAPS
jgi:hypothetical protein